jgi:hypothetical protein
MYMSVRDLLTSKGISDLDCSKRNVFEHVT